MVRRFLTGVTLSALITSSLLTTQVRAQGKVTIQQKIPIYDCRGEIVPKLVFYNGEACTEYWCQVGRFYCSADICSAYEIPNLSEQYPDFPNGDFPPSTIVQEYYVAGPYCGANPYNLYLLDPYTVPPLPTATPTPKPNPYTQPSGTYNPYTLGQ